MAARVKTKEVAREPGRTVAASGEAALVAGVTATTMLAGAVSAAVAQARGDRPAEREPSDGARLAAAEMRDDTRAEQWDAGRSAPAAAPATSELQGEPAAPASVADWRDEAQRNPTSEDAPGRAPAHQGIAGQESDRDSDGQDFELRASNSQASTSQASTSQASASQASASQVAASQVAANREVAPQDQSAAVQAPAGTAGSVAETLTPAAVEAAPSMLQAPVDQPANAAETVAATRSETLGTSIADILGAVQPEQSPSPETQGGESIGSRLETVQVTSKETVQEIAAAADAAVTTAVSAIALPSLPDLSAPPGLPTLPELPALPALMAIPARILGAEETEEARPGDILPTLMATMVPAMPLVPTLPAARIWDNGSDGAAAAIPASASSLVPDLAEIGEFATSAIRIGFAGQSYADAVDPHDGASAPQANLLQGLL